MSNHLFIRLTSILTAITILSLIPAALPAKDNTASYKTGARVININTADEAQLTRLPGIGPSIAERIVRHRQEVGRFKTTEELKQVKGIGDKLFLKIKDLIVTTDRTS